MFGVVVLVWATSGGVAAYTKVSVEWHMVQHMALAMVVPIFLVLGMPTTLALRALRPGKTGDRGPREWLLQVLHSGASALMTHPLVVLGIGTVGLFGLYFTPLFPLSMSSHLGHLLMGLHFLFSGFLFFWVVIGLDPGPRQVPPWARLLLLFIFISLHAFFAIGIMSMTTPLGAEWYAQVQPPWLTDPLRDTIDGGSVAWAFGEIPALIVMIAVALQWSRSDARIAKRIDRQADRDGNAELGAYNERLSRLAEHADAAKSDASKYHWMQIALDEYQPKVASPDPRGKSDSHVRPGGTEITNPVLVVRSKAAFGDSFDQRIACAVGPVTK